MSFGPPALPLPAVTEPADATNTGFLAIDLGPSRLTAGVVDQRGEVVLRDRVATPSRNVWPALTQLVRRVLAAKPADLTPIAVGLTCPGPIDHGTGSMKPVGMPTWHDFPLRRELSSITNLPVYIDTAGRGLARAELWRGDFAGVAFADQNFATLSVGDEVDGALVNGGLVLTGLTDNLGQFGHLIVEPGGATCVCGAAGCLAAYASVRAIEASTGRELRRTPPARIDNVGTMIARACASLAAMLDVAEIVIGGVVPEVLGPPLFEALAKEFEVRSCLPHLGSVRVRGVSSRQVGPLAAAAAVALAQHRVDAVAPD